MVHFCTFWEIWLYQWVKHLKPSLTPKYQVIWIKLGQSKLQIWVMHRGINNSHSLNLPNSLIIAYLDSGDIPLAACKLKFKESSIFEPYAYGSNIHFLDNLIIPSCQASLGDSKVEISKHLDNFWEFKSQKLDYWATGKNSPGTVIILSNLLGKDILGMY